jgi:FtsZ-interacting cell division protein ZipA
MTALQIALIVAGVVLVIGVIAYNSWQERRLKREAGHSAPGPAATRPTRVVERVEPTLSAAGAAPARESTDGMPAFAATDDAQSEFEPPLDVIAPPALEPSFGETDRRSAARDAVHADVAGIEALGPEARAGVPSLRPAGVLREPSMPDHEIECLIPLQPAAPVAASALGTGLHARIGKTLRWFGRPDPRSDWQRLAEDTPGRFADLVACLLLADRNGAASRAQVDTFVRVVGDIAPMLPAAFTPPDIAREVARAEALDRLCAELDVQIGLTVQKPDPGSIPGTRLRGVVEAAGFRLAPGGRFEYVQEDTGAVLYTLQNLRPDAFTIESLRLTATNGVVFVLDVARTSDPVRTFDQMKMVARRMAKTLGAELVDDNHRPLDDAALTTIREQVEGAADALRSVHIEPGSTRALALFSA